MTAQVVLAIVPLPAVLPLASSDTAAPSEVCTLAALSVPTAWALARITAVVCGFSELAPSSLPLHAARHKATKLVSASRIHLFFTTSP